MADQRLYTVGELAEVLRESERASRDRLYRGDIDYINIGTQARPRLRVTQAALDTYLEKLASDHKAAAQ